MYINIPDGCSNYMDWSVPKENLVLKINHINSHKSKGSDWSKKRNDALIANKYCCSYCGGKYLKYLIGVYVNDSVQILCRACYLINNINMGFNNEIILCYSKLSQLDIVKKTVNHIIDTDEIPTPTEIDKNSKMINLSIMELSNLLLNIDNIDKKFKHFNRFKIFFSKGFDINFIRANRFNITSMFIDDDDDTAHIYNTDSPECPENMYKFNKTEDKLIKMCFT